MSLTLLVLIALQPVDDAPSELSEDPPEASLSDAVVAGDIDTARALLASGADPDKPRVHGFTPLMRAVIRDDDSMIRLLLDGGADFEAAALEGLTPLHIAAEADSVNAVNLLLDAGADLNMQSHNGMNTLEHSAAAGAAEVIVALAATGVDLDAQSDISTQGHGYPIDIGSTALGIASRAGHIEAITALLNVGADVDAPSLAGHTPLLLAIFSGQPPEVISLLLEAGADPEARAACRTRCTYDEGDALTWARRLGDPDSIPLIEASLDR